MSKWKTIESVPMNGERFLVYVPELRYNTSNPTIIARFYRDDWEYEGGWRFVEPPTHWQPLPEPPHDRA